jgi:phosphoglycerol transferase MdoB-like AlkP superfamily enzyme
MILKQVPFIVHLPDGKYAGTHTNVGGQLDVTPTILHLLGISTADMTLLGQPLITSQPQSKLVVQRNGAFTDGTVYYMPSGDAVAENGKCWNIAANALGDVGKCLGAVEDARTELSMSDQIVQHDLIASFRAATVEASADGGEATAANTSGAGK